MWESIGSEVLGNVIVFLYKIDNEAKTSWNTRDIVAPKC